MRSLEFITVPGGTLSMGAPAAFAMEWPSLSAFAGMSPERIIDELPAHAVPVETFELAVVPCTNATFARFVAGGGYSDPGLYRALIQDVGAKVKATMATFTDETGNPGPASWRDGTFLPGTDEHPVHGISFYEADACARFFSVRLATEAEWEHAARLPDGRLFPWGPVPHSNEVANFAGVGLGTTSPVGRWVAGRSHLGCDDMAGNVHEWTSTRYTAYPGGRVRYRFAGNATARVARGGDFRGEIWDLRTTSRFGVNARSRFSGLGCRFARTKQ
jgi:formylglycine-generating enzyme required for sulfatase activity